MKIILSLIMVVLLFGCATVPPPVLTSDRAGNVLTMEAIPETGSRSDTPTGVAPRQVTAEVITKSGAKATIVKRPFHKPVVYLNEQAKAEGLTVVQPKDPWWKWPLMILITLAAVVGVYFLKQIRLFISTIFRR